MKTADQIVNDILTQLRLLDPTISAEIGTPERKIIEACAEQIARGQVDFTVLNAQHDLTQMSGNRLDAYLGGVFAFGRQQAMPSVGIVTFSRTEAAVDPIIIPRGTQVVAQLPDEFFPELRFITTEAGVIPAGGFSADVPVQCTVTGTVGNIAAGLIVGFAGLTSISGISAITNDEPMQGGVDGEDDAGYKLRFQNTFFRNMAGTYDNIMALAVAQAAVTKANVVGPLSRYQEYVLIPASNDASQITRRWDGAAYTTSGTYDPAGTTWVAKRTTAYSTIPYSKYTYLQQHFLTDGTLDPATARFFRHGIDFVFNAPPNTIPTDSPQTQQLSTTPVAGDSAPAYKPNITFLADAWPNSVNDLDAGMVLLMEHAYMSKNSRNDYALGIMNCVDVFVNGSKPKKASSIEIVPSGTTNVLQNTNASVWNYQKTTATKVINFRRPVDGKASVVGSIVMPLFWQPVIEAPDKIIIGSDTYFRGNYWNSGATGANGGQAYYNLKKTEGTSTGGNTSTTIKDTKKSWTVNAYTDFVVEIVSGTGSGQSRRIASNTANAITVTAAWSTTPNKTSKYRVLARKAHYVTTHEVNGYLGTIRARSGIEWFQTGNNWLAGKRAADNDKIDASGNPTYTGVKIETKAGTQIDEFKNYTYDENIASLQAILEKNKQTTTDVLAHRARTRYFKPIVTIMYSAGSNRAVVDASIRATLEAFWESQYFGAAIQLSDILQTIHNTPGVDNIRFTNDTGAGNKVEEVNADGTALEDGATYFTKDFFIQDSELPASPSENWALITARSQNTWST